MNQHEEKICAICGRSIQWRRKWARDWASVRYCSRRCRNRRLNDTDRALERAILDLLAKRARGASICPSEAARQVATDTEWQGLMERTREAARRLIARGKVQMRQGGRVVDASTARGPVRLYLRP